MARTRGATFRIFASGNFTKEGITADLEWMKRVGIAGMQMFDGSLGIPQFTDKRLVWMTPEWKDALQKTRRCTSLACSER
jgi:hypothetical protein